MTSPSISSPGTASVLLPLTPTQEEIWLEQRKRPSSTLFLLVPYYLLPVAIDVDLFRRAADDVFASHDALFMRLHAGPDGVPLAGFDPADAQTCRYLDLSGERDPEEALMREMELEQSGRAPFELLDVPLCRCFLYKLNERLYCFVAICHHIANDAWGLGILFSRVADRYRELKVQPDCPPPPRSRAFEGYLRDGTEPQEAGDRAKDFAFWKDLQRVRPQGLRASHAVPGPDSDQRCGRIEFTVPRELAARLAHAVEGVTFFHVLVLAWSQLLRRTCALDPCTLSLPVLNRRKAHKETLGLFVEARQLPIPCDDDASVADNLRAVARRMRDYFRHYRLSNTEIARLAPAPESGWQGGMSACGVLSYVTRDYGAEVEGQQIFMRNFWQKHEQAPFSLYVLDTYPERDVEFYLLHQLRVASPEEAALLPARFLHILEQIASGLERPLREMEFLPDDERARIQAFLDKSREKRTAPRTMLDEIVERVRRHPEAAAIEEADGRRVSYAELLDRARGLALTLQREGVRRGDKVMLLLPRSAELIASILAVWWCGAAYVPVDPATPEIRVRSIGELGAVRCAVANEALRTKAGMAQCRVLLADAMPQPGDPGAPKAGLTDLAYVIFTSGSTGQPKGVMIGHQALADHMANWRLLSQMEEGGERALFFPSPAFDASVDLFLSILLGGNTLVCAPHPQWPPHEMAAVIVKRELTLLDLPPAYCVELLKLAQDSPGLLAGHRVRHCIVGGEVMSVELASLWEPAFGPEARLHNIYGPTEVTVSVTEFAVPPGYLGFPGEGVPIGSPYDGQRLRVVDAQGRDIPFGVEGELLIGGVGLADGYLGRPEETAARFPETPGFGRHYRSGDLVRLRVDGQLVFIRRMDDQVKVRGFRIEPGEIEAALDAIPEVYEAAVVAPPEARGENVLHGFVTPRDGRVLDLLSLRRQLERSLPDYMVPRLHELAALPKSQSGKVDRGALVRLAQAAPPPDFSHAVSRPPAGPVQEYLALLWTQTLGRKVDDVDADFFVLGGHSLLAARLITAMSKAFRVEFPFGEFFFRPTIEHCERRLQALVGAGDRLEKMARLRLELAQLSPEQIKARLENLRP